MRSVQEQLRPPYSSATSPGEGLAGSSNEDRGAVCGWGPSCILGASGRVFPERGADRKTKVGSRKAAAAHLPHQPPEPGSAKRIYVEVCLPFILTVLP